MIGQGSPLGPILAVGAISLGNEVIIHGQKVSMRIIVGTGLAAMGLSVLEDLIPGLGTGIAWLTLVTVLLVRINPAVPSPVETINDWFKKVS
jgi:hypothetical protein